MVRFSGCGRGKSRKVLDSVDVINFFFFFQSNQTKSSVVVGKYPTYLYLLLSPDCITFTDVYNIILGVPEHVVRGLYYSSPNDV